MSDKGWVSRVRISCFFSSAFATILVLFAHTPVCAQRLGNLSDPAYKQSVVRKIDSLVENKYVLQESAVEHARRFRDRYTSGVYRTITDPGLFAETVTADLIEISGDAHFSMRVKGVNASSEAGVGSLYHPVRYFRLGKREHLGYAALEWLEGNVGYLGLRRFYPLSVSKAMVDAAMLFLSAADAIIIDVRENGGGAGESLTYFCSYFLDYPTQLTSHYSREDDFLTEFWTVEEIAGERRTDVPIFILTGEDTFSSAEIFAYDMKVRGRATLVGASTRGGAHSVDLYQIDDQFEIYVPTSRAVNPVTNSNWEGTGVVPDVVTPSDAALDTALVLARVAAENYALGREGRLNLAVDRMQQLLDDAEEYFRNGGQEQATLLLDSAFQVGDSASLTNQFFLAVLSYDYASDADEEMLYGVLDEWVERFPDSPTAWEFAGQAYSSKGRTRQALECYEKVLELDPENPNVGRLIERLRGS